MLFTNLNGFKWVQDDGTMLIFMVEMSTKKRKKTGHKKKRSPAAPIILGTNGKHPKILNPKILIFLIMMTSLGNSKI